MNKTFIAFVLVLLVLSPTVFMPLECRAHGIAGGTEMIPMRDGVRLATDLYFPEKGDGPFPVVLMRTPYNKDILRGYGGFFSGHGYVLAAQDVRGRFESEGDWKPFINEGEDGYDTVEWLAEQSWSTGKIGMYGGSYSGSVQFFTAVLKPPHLVTILPNITPAMPFHNMPYEGGSFMTGFGIRWIDIIENAKTAAEMGKKVQESFTKDWFKLLNHLPVIDLDKKILGKENACWREWIKHNRSDAYWEKIEYLHKLKDLDLPVFLQTGWYDGGNRGTKLAYDGLIKSKNRNIKMIVGPWIHTDRSSAHLYGQYMGEEAGIDLFELYRRWFDYWLKGERNGILEEPLVKVFDMGPNRWLESDIYPLPNTTFTKFYLTSENGANTTAGDGKLQLDEPSSNAEYDAYTYDPDDPSPCFFAHLKKRALTQYAEQVSSRDDILVYETAPFQQPLTVAGPLSAVLFASTSARDTDWSVTLYGISEKGEAYPMGMTWGVLRARFRSSMDNPQLLEKDKVYQYVIDLSHTGITLPKGDRLRMEISSAAFPEYSRNLNTGGHNEMDTEYVKARQRIYHSPQYPSHLILPVIGPGTGTVRDIDGNVYKTVKIGNQWWMAENLRVTRNPQGEPIKGYYYKDDPTTYGKYGLLYTWDVAMSGSVEEGTQGIAPDGWHIPSEEDWEELMKTLGGEAGIAEMIKVGGETGFDAHLSGGADAKGNYLYFDKYAMFWSSTASNDERAYHMGFSDTDKWEKFAAKKAGRIHVRCIKDE